VEFCIVVNAAYQGSRHLTKLIAHLDPVSGSMLGIYPLPVLQVPWFQEPLQTIAYTVGAVMGDIDRDGLKEYGLNAVAPDDLIISDLAPLRWAILGLRTWFLAAQAQVGATVTGTISIPSAPDHHFNLLLSRGFDATGGVRLGNWKTHLTPDTLLTKTMTDKPYTGQLGPDGKGSVSFTIPNDSHLVGQTLYSKVVILTPGNPSEVWTMSTLGQTQIVP